MIAALEKPGQSPCSLLVILRPISTLMFRDFFPRAGLQNADWSFKHTQDKYVNRTKINQ
jgi:hypothetical protein